MLSLNTIERTDLQQTVSFLEQALYNHQQWYNSLVRTLVCRLPPDNNDTLSDSHTRCRFGQWYYGNTPTVINQHAGFVAIGESHKRMHQLARKLLEELNSLQGISPISYDYFANALDQMRIEVSTLKHELEYLLQNRDPLTGTLSRITMLTVLREQQELLKRQGGVCCIAMLDFDLFKNINDQYGHNAGDIVLSSVARLLTEQIRPYDKIFRFGGEEFLFCFPFTKLSDCKRMLERFRKEIQKMPININSNQSIQVTVSIGLALLHPEYEAEQSVEHADKAMYEAKKAGRNCVKGWSED